MGKSREAKHAYNVKYYARNRERLILATQEWTRNNIDRARANWKRSKVARKHITREHRLSQYGLTAELYQTLAATQNGVCAICKQKETLAKNLAVDHDHTTGKVRGLLCMKCNTAIGKLPTAELLESAKNYLLGGGI